jgi:hypothetical protein
LQFYKKNIRFAAAQDPQTGRTKGKNEGKSQVKGTLSQDSG